MKMVSLCHPVRIRTCGKFATRNAAAKVLCSMETPPSQSTIKVVIIGATKEIGRTAIVAVSKARGMELAGAIDSQGIGEDAGQISGMEEPLEIPVLNDLTMVLGSIAQVHTFCRCKFSGCFFRASSANCVVCSFSREQLAWLLISVNLQTVYDNVKQVCRCPPTTRKMICKLHQIARYLIPKLNKYCYANRMVSYASKSPRVDLSTKLTQDAMRFSNPDND